MWENVVVHVCDIRQIGQENANCEFCLHDRCAFFYMRGAMFFAVKIEPNITIKKYFYGIYIKFQYVVLCNAEMVLV